MTKKNIGIFIGSVLSISCSIETLNYMSNTDKGQIPTSLVSNFGDNYIKNKVITTEISIEKVKYLSDLSNIITVFPKFENSTVNAEIRNLKAAIQSYIYATTEADFKQKKVAYRGYAQSYKTLQSLKKCMNSDNVELIERYLTRIKANINSLEYLNVIQ